MPRYFFHIHNGEKTIPVLEGSELPDQAAVGKEANTGSVNWNTAKPCA